MEDSQQKEKLNKPKEAYVKRTLKFLKNAMRNVLKEYYTEANNNIKEKDKLELPTKEKFNKMYSRLTTYNKDKKSAIKLKMEEIQDLWKTAKSEIADEIKRLGQDGYDFDKQLASDSVDLVPDMSDMDGVESLIEIPQQEVYMNAPELSIVALQKLHYLLSTMPNQDFVSWYLQSGSKFLMEYIKTDIVFKDTPKYCINQEISTGNNFGLSGMININHQVKQQIQDLLLKIDREKTTEQDVFILQIDNLINKVISQYQVSKNSTDKPFQLTDIETISELSNIVGEECAINIYLLFYFDMILQPHLCEIDSLIKINLKFD